MTREQVGWVRFDGDEYHDFRYSAPSDRGLPASMFEEFLPVYVDIAAPIDPRCKYEWPLPGWMGIDQADPCRCDLPDGHFGKHECEHIRAEVQG